MAKSGANGKTGAPLPARVVGKIRSREGRKIFLTFIDGKGRGDKAGSHTKACKICYYGLIYLTLQRGQNEILELTI